MNRMKFVKLCGKHGVLLEDVLDCIQSMNGDMWIVETDSPLFPLNVNNFGSENQSTDITVESLNVDNIMLSGNEENINITQKNFVASKHGVNSQEYAEVDEKIKNSHVDMPAHPVGSPQYFEAERKLKDPHDIGQGAGTELKKMLAMIGITSTPNCSCNKRAKIMNEKGTAWCKKNKEQILEWMREESEKRHLPFLKFAATRILNYAIAKAAKKEK